MDKTKGDSSSGKFAFGYTATKPLILKVLINFEGEMQERAVAVLPGGNDATIDTSSYTKYVLNTSSTVGSSIYFVDIETGKLIREITHSDSPRSFSSSLIGFPNTPGLATRVFAGDVSGRIFRIDLQNVDPTQWSIKLFYNIYRNDNPTGEVGPNSQGRPLLMHPTLVLNQRGELVLLGGTGDTLDHEKIHAGKFNRFFSIRETFDASALGTNGLIDNDQVKAVSNYVFQLIKIVKDDGSEYSSPTTDKTGEKLTGAPVVLNGVAYFSTYTPNPSNTAVCGITGEARVYAIDFEKSCTTASCQSLHTTGLIDTSTSPILCCQCEGESLNSSCADTNPVCRPGFLDDTRKCYDLRYTVPKFLDSSVTPNQYYRYRSLGPYTYNGGIQFEQFPSALIGSGYGLVNSANAGKGHTVNTANVSTPYLSAQTGGKNYNGEGAFALESLRVVKPETDTALSKGNVTTVSVDRSKPNIRILSWGSIFY